MEKQTSEAKVNKMNGNRGQGRIIRYFPNGVDQKQVWQDRRVLLKNNRQQSTKTIMCRASAAARCGCISSPSPPSAKCPVKSHGHTLQKVLARPWVNMDMNEKVELMMASGHPVMSSLSVDYFCEDIHLVVTLCQKEHIESYLDKTHVNQLGAKDSMGNTAFLLLVASKWNPVLLVKKVVEAMKKEDATNLIRLENNDGMTALHFAVLFSRRDLVALFLSLGADVDAGTVELRGQKYGVTPLHLSLMRQSRAAYRCFRQLLIYRADLSVELLVSTTPNDTGGFWFECLCGGCWSTAIKQFGFICPKNSIGNKRTVSIGTALNIAMAFKDYKKAACLSRFYHQFDINLTNGIGMSPLFQAILTSNLDLVLTLLASGADVHKTGVDQENNYVESPLELAHLLVSRGNCPVHSKISKKMCAILQRIHALDKDNLVCSWCQQTSLKPRSCDNVSDIERRIFFHVNKYRLSSMNQA